MNLKSVFNFCLVRTFEVVVVILLLIFLPNLPPYAKISEPYKITPSLPLEGKLAPNEKLAKVEIWHKGDFVGPEAFAAYKNELYTGIHGGDVVKLTGNHVTPVIKFGKPCKGIYQEKICGRPLGLEFDDTGRLYVADAYYGIFVVYVQTGDYEQLVSPNDKINGKECKLFNSVTVSKSGDIFWSCSSTEFDLQNGLFDIFADGTGFLVHFDHKTKENRVLIDSLVFANGVQLSDDESFVLVNDLNKNRILRYHLKGPKKGTQDVFIDGLPGMPDNLGKDGKGGFLVPLVVAVDQNHPCVPQMLSQFPLLRRLIARVLGLVEAGFGFLDRIYPNEFAERAVHFMGHFTSITGPLTPKRVTILRVSKDGEILDSLQTTSGNISGIAEAFIFKDTLYLGSPFNDYIGRIKLKEVGWEELEQKPIKQTTVPPATPPSTTTTPPPTKAPPTTNPPPTTTTTTPPPSKATSPPPTTTTTTAPPKKTEAKQAAPQKIDPKQALPQKTEPKQAPQKAEPKQAPPLKTEPKQAPPQKMEPKQAPPKKVKQEQVPPKKTAPTTQAPLPKQQQPKVGVKEEGSKN